MSADGYTLFGADSAGRLGPPLPTADSIVMHRKFPASLIALIGAIHITLVAAFLDGGWDADLFVSAGMLGLLYYLPLYLVVKSFAPKQVQAWPVLVGAVMLATIFVPLLADFIGIELALVLTPLLVWSVLALPAIVLLQDVEPVLVRGVCNRCGYDLTGNETGVCPECGRPVENPGHVSFRHRWRGSLPGQLGRWAAAVTISLFVVMIAGVVVPQFTDTGGYPGQLNIHAPLQTLRSQIELHNVQNPSTPFDPIAHGWDQLIDGFYLQTQPKNPYQNGSTKISTAPAAGVGWFWAIQNGWPTMIYAVDDKGGGFDYDGDGVWD